MFEYLPDTHNTPRSESKTQVFVDSDAMDLAAEYWADSRITVGALRNRVMAHCWQVLKENELDWDDVRRGRKQHAVEIRGRLCCFAYEVLTPWMHETEIAELIGVPRSGFMDSRRRWAKKHGA